MKKAKNVVFLNADSVTSIQDIPVLIIKANIPEIVVDGYKIKKNTKSLYLTLDLIHSESFIIFSDHTSLENHISKIAIYDMGTLKKHLTSYVPIASKDIISGLILQSLINYILQTYSDYDGFNIGKAETDAAPNVESSDLNHFRDQLDEYSDMILRLLED